MKKKNINFLTLFIIAALFATGLFYEFLSCIFSAVLCIYLIIVCKKEAVFRLNINLSSVSVFLIPVSYLVVSVWAIDRGDAIIGFFKFLPVALFLLIIMQNESLKPNIEAVPYSMAVMTVISAVLMQIPALSKYFSVSGRLSGFLQYSNTFALLLLVSLIIIVTKTEFTKADAVTIPILLFGIVYSGSRTVFILMVVAIAFIVFTIKNKKVKFFLCASALVIVAVVVLYAVITKNYETLGRFLTISSKSSTFIGRFLYFRDALPLIAKHPFGLGYMGYYYVEQSIQTGLYSVKYLHNDFLQLMLDIGWVPALVFIAAIVKSFFKKGNSVRNRLVLLIISMHCCFDFDLQYVAVFMLFILFLDYDDGKEIYLSCSSIAIGICASLIAVICTYVATAQALFTFNNYSASQKLYPWNTQISITQLTQTKNTDEMELIAENILKRNSYVALAYSAKATAAYSDGDIAKVIEYKNKIFEIAPFSYSEYEQYCYMMISAAQMYVKNGDSYSAKVCLDELAKTIKAVENIDKKMSKLGKMIDDQPQTELPKEILEFAEANCYD